MKRLYIVSRHVPVTHQAWFAKLAWLRGRLYPVTRKASPTARQCKFFTTGYVKLVSRCRKADCKYMLRGVCKVDFPVFTKLTVINLNRSPAAGANIESIFMTQPNGIIKILIFLLRSRLEHSPRMRKVGCLNPRHHRPKW